jgi:hypothetical protein
MVGSVTMMEVSGFPDIDEGSHVREARYEYAAT